MPNDENPCQMQDLSDLCMVSVALPVTAPMPILKNPISRESPSFNTEGKVPQLNLFDSRRYFDRCYFILYTPGFGGGGGAGLRITPRFCRVGPTRGVVDGPGFASYVAMEG